MFSPSSTAAPAASIRNTRRRPRPSSSDSLASQPKAKRQRSALNEQTFIPPDDPPQIEVIVQKAVSASPESPTGQIPKQQLSVRGNKYKANERATKDDGSILLTSNDTYTVSRLPACPDRLYGDETVRQHGGIYSDSGYALLLSRNHALVWNYTNNAALETFCFDLPHTAKTASEPLPLGALVSPSASSSEPGLVVVMPTRGKITYWESIASATTMDLIQQQRNGVELSIPGMVSGELVIQILNAESAGFVLGFSTGRFAYMSVRDNQGRPDISVHFLRATVKRVSSIFGSLRNVLGNHTWHGDLAAVRSGPAMKPGERDVVSITSKGRLQTWNLYRGGHNFLCAEVETREAIVLAMKDSEPRLSDLLIESFEAIDVAFSPKRTDDGDSEDSEICFFLLVSLSGQDICHYALVQVALKAGSLDICMVRHIRTYTKPVNYMAISRPRLYVPEPGLVSFLVFDRAVVIVSLAERPYFSESQLLTEGDISTESFEDVVNFREDKMIEIVGSGMEEPHTASHSIEEAKSRRHKAKFPAVVLLAKGGGVIRIAATGAQKLTAKIPPQVTAKSKLEQAVFFGTLENNPLNFGGRAELHFTSKEIGEAALALSHEIMSSTTPYIPSLPASVEDHLHRRSTALQNLAAHLKAVDVALDRITRWRLLWNAEKIAGAKLIWKRYDEGVKQKPVGRKRGLLNDLVEYIHERYRSEPVAEAGELDRARHWFINDVSNIEIAIPWAYKAVRCAYNEGEREHTAVMALVSEADDFISGALGAAFEFRALNLELYGLESEELENGVLTKGYGGLPRFWTSTPNTIDYISRLMDLSRSFATEYWKKPGSRGFPDKDLAAKVRLDNIQLVDLFCRCYTERGRWLLSREDSKLREEGEILMGKQPPPQGQHIYLLKSLELPNQAMELAVRHKAFPILAALFGEDLTAAKIDFARLENHARKLQVSDTEELSECRFLISQLRGQEAWYYKSHGASFANALYTYYIQQGMSVTILEDLGSEREYQRYVTNFLRSKKQYAKVNWINEVIQERDFDRASKSLLDVGLRRELCLWDKKVELSLGKLSRLAGKKVNGTSGSAVSEDGDIEFAETKKHLALARIQDKVFDHVCPVINAAIDEKAELQLAMEVYGNKNLKGMDALSRLLEENMGRLINHRSLATLDLVDLLTLMGRNDKLEETGLIHGLEFYMALQALKCGPATNDEQILVQRIIWRRCLIRDDWAETNNTDLKDDEQVSYQLRETALYSTLKACLKNRIFEKPSLFSPISPAQILDSCTQELDERFKGLDASVRGPILKDMQAENERLRHYIEKCRLEKWFESALDLAKSDVAEDINVETETGRALQKAAVDLAQVEDQIAKAERQRALELLRSKPRHKAWTKFNGSASFLRSSVKR